MARFKVEGPAALGEYGIEYVVNPSGTVWAVHEDHPAPGWPRKPGDPVRTVVELATRREDGWRLATPEEIRKHAERTGEWLPPELDEKPKPPNGRRRRSEESSEAAAGPEAGQKPAEE